MATDASKVRVAVTGAVYFDSANTATAPTGTASATTGFVDLGYISEDGVVLGMPDAGDTTSLKAWQNGATVRVMRSAPDDVPTLQLTLIETSLATIQTTFGVTVTQTSTEGTFVINTNTARTPGRLLFDVIDGAELIRGYAPQAVVASIGEINLTSTDAIGYQLTFDLQFNQALGGNVKVWATALKS
jgi:hypothetical protein